MPITLPALRAHNAELSAGLWPQSPLRRYLLWVTPNERTWHLLHGPQLENIFPSVVHAEGLCGNRTVEELEEFSFHKFRGNKTKTLSFVVTDDGSVHGLEVSQGDLIRYDLNREVWEVVVRNVDNNVPAGTCVRLYEEHDDLLAPYDSEFTPGWWVHFDGESRNGVQLESEIDGAAQMLSDMRDAFEGHAEDVEARLETIVREARPLLDNPGQCPQQISADAWARRIANLRTLVETYDVMVADNWHPYYIAEFLRIQLKIREARIHDAFPEELMREDSWVEAQTVDTDAAEAQYLDLTSGVAPCEHTQSWRSGIEQRRTRLSGRRKQMTCCTLVTKAGVAWGTMRTGTGPSARFHTLLPTLGGDRNILLRWVDGQEGSSWSAASTKAKAFFARARTADLSDYFWFPVGTDGEMLHKLGLAAPSTKSHPLWVGEEDEGEFVLQHYFDYTVAHQCTLIAEHAFTYEFLRATALPNVEGNNITMIRMEKRASLRDNEEGVPEVGSNLTKSTRGPAESFSLVRGYRDPSKDDYSDGNFYATTVTVPRIRVFATYIQSKPGTQSTLFLHDGENEILAMTEGVDAVFRGKDRTYYCHC